MLAWRVVGSVETVSTSTPPGSCTGMWPTTGGWVSVKTTGREGRGSPSAKFLTCTATGAEVLTPGAIVTTESPTSITESARLMTVSCTVLEESEPANAWTCPGPGATPVTSPVLSMATVGSAASQVTVAATSLPSLSSAWAESCRFSPTSTVVTSGTRTSNPTTPPAPSVRSLQPSTITARTSQRLTASPGPGCS